MTLTAGDIGEFVGACILAWTLGWCGGMMVLRIRQALDYF